MATGVSQLPPAKVSVTPMPWKNTPGICGMTASAEGLPPATFSVPLSTDPADAVLAVAAASVGLADTGRADE